MNSYCFHESKHRSTMIINISNCHRIHIQPSRVRKRRQSHTNRYLFQFNIEKWVDFSLFFQHAFTVICTSDKQNQIFNSCTELIYKTLHRKCIVERRKKRVNLTDRDNGSGNATIVIPLEIADSISTGASLAIVGGNFSGKPTRTEDLCS